MSAAVSPRVPAALLTGWLTNVFASAGFETAHAAAAATILVRTSLRGIDTHGVALAPAYVEQLRSGELNGSGSPSGMLRAGVLHVEGYRCLGQVVGTYAVDRAIAEVRSRAFAPCVIHGSGHLAALGMFTLRAAEQGMVAFLCQATPPIMAVQGARIPAIGNNPLSFAAPLRDRPPLVFDMAASTVARGHVAAAARDGLAIPPDWAIGPDGNLTQDPNQALLGAMLPVAGHKGLGLAMLVQCLTVSLAGSGLADSWTAGNSPAFLMLINPDLMDGRVAFEARTEAWLATYLATFPAAHRYPGQRAAECEAERSANGIPLSLGLLATLQRVGELTGVRPPFS